MCDHFSKSSYSTTLSDKIVEANEMAKNPDLKISFSSKIKLV